MEQSITTTYKNALIGGAIVGIAAGMLFAPRTGLETRQLWKGKAESARRMAREYAMTHHRAERSRRFYDDEVRARKLAALHMETDREVQMHSKILTMGFITGAIVGGVLGLLYAPKTGKETREFLKTKAEYTREEARAVAGRAKDIALAEARKARAAAAAALRDAEMHEAEAREAEAQEAETQQSQA